MIGWGGWLASSGIIVALVLVICLSYYIAGRGDD